MVTNILQNYKKLPLINDYTGQNMPSYPLINCDENK